MLMNRSSAGNLMMARSFVLLFWFHLLSYGCCQLFEGISSQQFPGASTGSRGSPLIRQVGDLLLDIDEAFYKITAPKVELERDLEEQKIRNAPDPIRRYFDRVRENYKNLQSKIGSTLEQSEGRFQMPNLFDINFQNRGSKSAVGVSLPFLPLNIQVNAKNPASESTAEAKPGSAEASLGAFEKQSVSDSSKIDDPEEKDTEIKKEEPLEKDSNKSFDEFQKRSNSHPRFPVQSTKSNLRRSTENFKAKPSWEANEHLKFLPSENGNEPLETDSMIQGRILGDLLYSESTFDKYFRRLLKNFKWIVDPSIFPAKELVENIRGITTGQFIDNSKNKNDSEKDLFVTKSPQKITSGLKQRKPNLEIKDAASVKHQSTHFVSRLDQDSKIIVAFTTEGVPLKLKIDSHSKNPLKFLQEALSSAGVSLNIPIDSRRNVHPVGSDILRLGSIPKGTDAKAIFVDTTDKKQLKSLIKNLKKYKMDD